MNHCLSSQNEVAIHLRSYMPERCINNQRFGWMIISDAGRLCGYAAQNL